MTETPLYRTRPTGFDIRPASQAAPTQVAESVYLSEGLSNTYLLTTREGRIVVNTGMGFEAPIHKRNFDSVDASLTRYILLTQGHVDHVGGVDLFRDSGTEVVAQSRNQAHQRDDARIASFRAKRSAFAFADAIAMAWKHIQEHAGARGIAQSRPEPDITFEDRMELELGGLRLELLATPGGETTDSMVVWLPEHRICLCGNLFSALFGHFPNLVTIRGDRYRDAPAFMASLDRVRQLQPEILLTGHHAPIRGRPLIEAELTRLHDAVEYVHEATVRGMNHGTDVHTLMREVVLPPHLEVGEGYGKVSWSVRAIWEQYAGWFHHRSTTELYSEPASVIHHDLVELAGGADALSDRARQRLESEEPIAAVHLAEVALTAEPDHVGALSVMVSAHERLEAESGNFWLTRWLQKELGLFRARLAAAERASSEADS